LIHSEKDEGRRTARFEGSDGARRRDDRREIECDEHAERRSQRELEIEGAAQE